MAGVTPEGFVPLTIDECRAALEAAFRGVLGAAVNVAPESRNGQLIGTFSEQLASAWAAGEGVAHSFDPSAATGAQLDNLAGLTGTARKAASKSQVSLTLTGTTGTVIALGKIASVAGTSSKFATKALATLAAASAWLATTAYAVGQRVRNGGTQRVYECITPGISAGAGGPTTTGDDVVDGAVHWRYLGNGNAFADVDAEATVTGPIQGYAFTVTTIDTAVSGWQGVTNLLDAVPGSDTELDPFLRARRDRELGGQGSSPVNAIRAAVLRVKDVTTCTVFENVTDVTVDGIPPHSVEALVEGGTNAAIAAALFAAAGGGIRCYGTTTVAVIDSAGNSHTIGFSRPTAVVLYVAVTLQKDPTSYPVDGDNQVKDQIVAVGDAQRLGRDAVGSQLSAWIFAGNKSNPAVDGIPGVLNITQVLVDTANPPLTTSKVLSPRQKADYDTSRIAVVSTNGTP